jgi:hypothetical protein
VVRLVWVVVVLAACGRVSFDEQRADAFGGDATEGSAADGETCMRARPLAIGVAHTNQSIEAAKNDHPNSACGGGPEVVYVFQQPALVRRSITLSADFDGASWYATTCPPVPGSCAGFGAGSELQISSEFRPGTVYVIIDKIGGSGTTFSIAVD